MRASRGRQPGDRPDGKGSDGSGVDITRSTRCCGCPPRAAVDAQEAAEKLNGTRVGNEVRAGEVPQTADRYRLRRILAAFQGAEEG